MRRQNTTISSPKYNNCFPKTQLLACSGRQIRGPRVQRLLNAGLPTTSTVRVKHLNLYEDLGLYHTPKVFLQQARTLNLSLLSPSQPSSYNPATDFEACISTEVSVQLNSNLYPDYCKTSLELHTSGINFLPYLSLTASVGL